MNQRLFRNWPGSDRCDLSQLLVQKITKGIHSCKPASLKRPINKAQQAHDIYNISGRSPHVVTGGPQLCPQTGQRAVKVSGQTSINIPRRHGLRGGVGNLRSLARTPTCLVPGIACLVMVTAEQGEKQTKNNENVFSSDTHPIISGKIAQIV